MELEGRLSQHLLHGFPAPQSIDPRRKSRIFSLIVPLRDQMAQQQIVPLDERQINIGELVTDQVLRLLLLQVRVDDAAHALRFVGVAVDRRGEVLLRWL